MKYIPDFCASWGWNNPTYEEGQFIYWRAPRLWNLRYDDVSMCDPFKKVRRSDEDTSTP